MSRFEYFSPVIVPRVSVHHSANNRSYILTSSLGSHYFFSHYFFSLEKRGVTSSVTFVALLFLENKKKKISRPLSLARCHGAEGLNVLWFLFYLNYVSGMIPPRS